MGACTPGFTAVANTLGGIDCARAPAFMSVRSPFALNNWTLPVVEALMVLGAVVSLVHAVLWWRRRGDPTNLGLWFATIVYVLVLEPPLYFPDRFGLQDQVGLIFVHNVFSVQFLYDRLPLYILAIYPALTYLVYALVQRTGVLDRRNAVLGAACVAFVFHCFYEIFDTIGPQLRWWAWNPDAPSNTPWLASVPVTSAVVFAGASPFGIALLTRWLIARRADRGPIPAGSMVLRVLAVGALTPLAMMVFSLPYGLLSQAHPPNVTGEKVALWSELALLGVVALATLRWVHQRPKGDGVGPDRARNENFLDNYGLVAGAVFLVVFAVLWGTALPDYLNAAGGRTASGSPTGSLAYAIGCAVVCIGVLALARRSRASAMIAESAGGLSARTSRRKPKPSDRTVPRT